MKKKKNKKTLEIPEIIEAYKKVRRAWTRNPRMRVKESAKLYKRKGRQRKTGFQ